MAVNKKHYYFSVKAFGKIEDAHFAYYADRFEAERAMKAVWSENFKLYNETEDILSKIQDANCLLFPLYRGIGKDESDFVFETREEAEKEYREHIDQAIADRMYDL